MGKYEPAGKYFEDLQVGDEYVTMARTVTLSDIEMYCNLSGDFNPLYTDEEFAKTDVYGTRIAPEFLVHSISTGQVNQTRLFEGTTLAFVGLDIEFVNPVKPGDTIVTKGKLIEKKETGKTKRGIVNFYVEVLNQRNEVISKSNRYIMLQRRNS
jgi:acyl dehydratase